MAEGNKQTAKERASFARADRLKKEAAQTAGEKEQQQKTGQQKPPKPTRPPTVRKSSARPSSSARLKPANSRNGRRSSSGKPTTQSVNLIARLKTK
jgi:hypothetical protein